MDTAILKYLYDIDTSIKAIYEYLGEKRDFDRYKSDRMLRRAVEREIEIIGEALNKLGKLDPELPISNKGRIIGMRNRVIHGYDKVDDELVWGTIIRYLPALEGEIAALLNERR